MAIHIFALIRWHTNGLSSRTLRNAHAAYLTTQHTLDRVLLEQRGAELREARGGEEEHRLGRLSALLLLSNVREQTAKNTIQQHG